MTKTILIIMGPSGVGKTTIGQELKKRGIPEIVSHTTRKMRVGEVDGETYHFVSVEEFERVEKIEEVCYAGNLYGISKREIESKLEKHDTVFTITDVEGVKILRESYPEEVKVAFIKADVEELKRRMEKRGDSEENIEKRIDHLFKTKEFESEKEADIVVSNDVLCQTIEKMEAFLNNVHVSIQS